MVPRWLNTPLTGDHLDGGEILSALLPDFTHRRTLTPVCNCSVVVLAAEKKKERRKKITGGRNVLSVQRSLMYVLYLEPDGSVGVRSSHAENWRCGFIYVLEGGGETTLQIRFCWSLKTLAQEMLKRKYFYLLSEKNMRELILGGINPDVLPASMWLMKNSRLSH